jgi:peptidoglycan-associated lipoprotein
MKRSGMVAIVAGLLAAAGCAHQQEVKPQPMAETHPAAAPVAAAQPPQKSCSLDSDCVAGQLCVNNQCVDITPELAECSEFRVHFAFNQWDVQSEDRPAVERMARCLRADRALHVTIEGNADERGTEEYNLHLGDKRANAVERLLANLGVSDAQLKTLSYGKDRPLCTEHDEACWSQNRRAALRPLIASSAR